ncbi:MAG TPA: NTP transferase domain-containing protein, partial [Bryobacteraceae bacterium]|nr:NTP transferase domain-containing protein [Bryobacteraceae bacterium]
METPVTIVILAAGLGTRMKSRKAKVLHEAGGRTLVEHVVRTALELAPPERVFVVVGYQADEVRQAVRIPGIGFIEQTEQLGTGHAVMAGREALAGLGGHLVIVYGDGPLLRAETLRRLIAKTESGDAAGTLLSAILEDPTGYGRVVRGERGHVAAIVEQKAATPEQLAIREANMGIYCYRAELFWNYIDQIRPDNAAREYYLTDMVEILNR